MCGYLSDVLFFFFFKQKTAYEMRISDWSSDVCSSDLYPVDRFLHVAVHVLHAVSAPVDAAAASADRLRITEIFLSLQGEACDAGWPKIGRASCRERVCQYV